MSARRYMRGRVAYVSLIRFLKDTRWQNLRPTVPYTCSFVLDRALNKMRWAPLCECVCVKIRPVSLCSLTQRFCADRHSSRFTAVYSQQGQVGPARIPLKIFKTKDRCHRLFTLHCWIVSFISTMKHWSHKCSFVCYDPFLFFPPFPLFFGWNWGMWILTGLLVSFVWSHSVGNEWTLDRYIFNSRRDQIFESVLAWYCNSSQLYLYSVGQWE